MRNYRQKHRHRRGIALVATIVAMSIALTLFGLWARSIVQEHRRAAVRQFRAQAVRLAEAGVRRGIAQRAANPQYDGETWSIVGATLGGPHQAQVRVRVAPTNERGIVRYEATAEFPAGATRRALITRQIEITTTPSETEP